MSADLALLRFPALERAEQASPAATNPMNCVMTTHIARCESALSREKGTAMAATDGLKTAKAGSRRTIASYSTYAEAERAVDWLADHGFAVEHAAIVGTGLRSVEQVAGRMTQGRAATIGAAQGALLGALFALLFGIFFDGPDFAELLLFSLALGGLFGALWSVLFQHADSGGKRDFVSAASIEADRYEVQVDEGAADEAMEVLGGISATR